MTGFAEGLKVVLIPEALLVAAVRLYVVTDELAGIAFDAAAAFLLAGE